QMGDGPSAEIAPAFEDRHRLSGPCEIDRSGQSGQPAADNNDVLAHEAAMVAHFARQAGGMAECHTGSGASLIHMQTIIRPITAAILLTLIAAAAPLRAATVNDFYVSL